MSLSAPNSVKTGHLPTAVPPSAWNFPTTCRCLSHDMRRKKMFFQPNDFSFG
ncbi:hypothetical protein HMPREF9441_02873 [Paraprevotella clara YIT 11840]|uniref:Uncharacterized protein n=1 Tax=Paraprevotella clara YIT 11840 TaxID=762968 RepID=G5SU18_9BACT|nr:hypothetical protein HMPREF9441_02873 [Paraprevotella clara YIT 11840]